jgi:cytochrome c peroxidase
MSRTALACLLGSLVACHPDDSAIDTGPSSWDDPFTADEAAVILQMSPLAAPPADPTNAWADDPAAAHLGQFLYYDKRFSSNGAVACVTCHDPEKGWSDGKRLGEGIGVGLRKVPSLWNAAYNRWMFWDGRADSLWSQALGPVENPSEMGGDRLAVLHAFAGDPDLKAAYEAVFEPLPDVSDLSRFPEHARPTPDDSLPVTAAWEAMSQEDRDTVDRFYSHFGKALEAYERSIVSRHAPVDDFVTAYRTGDVAALEATDPELLVGAKIFAGEGKCHLCHLGANFTSGEFNDIGLEIREWMPKKDTGRYDGIPIVLNDPFNGAGAFSDDPAVGAEKLDHLAQTGQSLGQFKVPSLRNVALIAPYMHGGQFDDLDGVVDYDSTLDEVPEISSGGHREELLQVLDLTDDEKAAVVAFLESLTGDDGGDIATGPPASPIP